MLLLVVLATALSTAAAVEFKIKNNLPGPIWVGILGNNGKPALENGGFELGANSERSVTAPSDWAGRFWARTWCDYNSKHCETGDCGNRLACNGAGGVPPVSLVEITLKGHEGLDFYDISLVDGFNVKASITPSGGSGGCKRAACDKDLNPNCPNDLKQIGKQAGYAIACNSRCMKYNQDKDCCRNAYNTPDKCPRNPGAQYFKDNCPDAYSYAYDDASSTFTCKANIYHITFG